MDFSRKTTELKNLYNVDPKDVLFALLVSAGASIVESFAVIHRTAATTNRAISNKASEYISARKGLQRLMADLDSQNTTTDADGNTVEKKRQGRPRKKSTEEEEDLATLDYMDKDAVLKELARSAMRAEKESDKIAAIREITALQRMKQEAAVEDEKRVVYYIPMDDATSTELLAYLRRYYAERDAKKG